METLRKILIYTEFNIGQNLFLVENPTGILFYVLGDVVYQLVSNNLFENNELIFKMAFQTFANGIIYDNYILMLADIISIYLTNLLK